MNQIIIKILCQLKDGSHRVVYRFLRSHPQPCICSPSRNPICGQPEGCPDEPVVNGRDASVKSLTKLENLDPFLIEKEAKRFLTLVQVTIAIHCKSKDRILIKVFWRSLMVSKLQ